MLGNADERRIDTNEIPMSFSRGNKKGPNPK
jgi:hypothetical protein